MPENQQIDKNTINAIIEDITNSSGEITIEALGSTQLVEIPSYFENTSQSSLVLAVHLALGELAEVHLEGSSRYYENSPDLYRYTTNGQFSDTEVLERLNQAAAELQGMSELERENFIERATSFYDENLHSNGVDTEYESSDTAEYGSIDISDTLLEMIQTTPSGSTDRSGFRDNANRIMDEILELGYSEEDIQPLRIAFAQAFDDSTKSDDFYSAVETFSHEHNDLDVLRVRDGGRISLDMVDYLQENASENLVSQLNALPDNPNPNRDLEDYLSLRLKIDDLIATQEGADLVNAFMVEMHAPYAQRNSLNAFVEALENISAPIEYNDLLIGDYGLAMAWLGEAGVDISDITLSTPLSEVIENHLEAITPLMQEHWDGVSQEDAIKLVLNQAALNHEQALIEGQPYYAATKHHAEMKGHGEPTGLGTDGHGLTAKELAATLNEPIELQYDEVPLGENVVSSNVGEFDAPSRFNIR